MQTVKYYIKKVDGLVLPTRATAGDAGYDVVATGEPKIVGQKLESDGTVGPSTYRSVDYVEYETNLYVTPNGVDHCYHTDLRPRSSISKYNLVLANSVGLIDRNYKNQILCRFKYIWQPTDFYTYGNALVGTVRVDKIYKKGDRIAQLLATLTNDIEFDIVNDLPGEDRGGGFGSTDSKKSSQELTTLFKQVQHEKKVTREFKLGTKTTIPHIPTKYQAEVTFRLMRHDGEFYTFTENDNFGICVVDSSGQVLDKFFFS